MSDVPAMNPARRLGEDLRDFCARQLELLAGGQLPGLVLPRTYGGHVVGADVRADLLYTLGHLSDAGVDTIGEVGIDSHIVTHLAQVRGAHTHTFFSYRVAETLQRAGMFEGNRYLQTLSESQRAEVALACSSTDWIALLDQGSLPRNYAAVLARCELAREALGLDVDPEVLSSLIERLHAFLGSNPRRFLDDSHDANGRYDIYTADVWLFCEPLAARLGGLWEEGIATALDLVDAVGARDGSAIAWGRSTGVLSIALTIELAALAVSQDRVPERTNAWLARGADALASMRGWYQDGIVNAHQYRDQDSYRGPERRLQLTLDVLGKIAWAAKVLIAADSSGAELVPRNATAPDASSASAVYPSINRFIAFEDDRPAGVWSFRSNDIEFALPFVGAARSHYYPSVHAPGCFEVPVDADLPCWTPLVHAGVGRYAGGGVPTEVHHAPGASELRAVWDGFVPTRFDWNKPAPEPFAGKRETVVRVEGRSIVMDEHLSFVNAPDSLTVMIPQTAARPLRVSFDAPPSATMTAVDVLGLKEWRSSWSEIAVVHQLDLEPAIDVRYSVRVTPKLRVASTAFGHHYHASLYGHMTDDVVGYANPLGPIGDAAVDLANIDVFHLHWPEFVGFERIETHRDIINTLRAHNIPIVWTAHNLTPHNKQPAIFDPIYSLWASSVDAMIHHSEYGLRRMLDRYAFADDCVHAVIPHGHFGDLWSEADRLDRDETERALGFSPCALRIGMVGAPRDEKLVQAFLDGFSATTRTDLQLACWSVGPSDVVPSDERIVAAEPYRLVKPSLYAQRLATVDVLALPFDPDGDMLATGTAADALGLGMASLTSEWEYLIETLGESAIVVGHTAEAIRAALDRLDLDAVREANAQARAQRERYEWADLARETAALFTQVRLAS